VGSSGRAGGTLKANIAGLASAGSASGAAPLHFIHTCAGEDRADGAGAGGGGAQDGEVLRGGSVLGDGILL